MAVWVLMDVVCGRLGLRELAAPEDWDVGRIYHWLGQALKAQSNLDLAVDLLEKALRYREVTLGKADDDTLDTASSLAWALIWKGEFDRALELYEEVAAAQKVSTVLSLVTSCGTECTRQENYSERSSEYEKPLMGMGVVYMHKGDLDRAAELCEQSADIIKVHQPQHAADSQLQLLRAGSRGRAERKVRPQPRQHSRSAL